MKTLTFTLLIFGISLTFPTFLLSQEKSDKKEFSLEILDYPQSLTELLKKFEGKVVYIDLMASWCRPCIAELKETKKNEFYFKENDIVKLFISLDNEPDIEKAISIIEKDSLNGFFISIHPGERLNPISTFSQEIVDLFMKDENGNLSLSIPMYAIVNKNGEIFEKRAERPSNFAILKKQFEKYLDTE